MLWVLGEQAVDKVFEFFRVAFIVYGSRRIIQNGGYCLRRHILHERDAKGAQLIRDDSDGPNILLLDFWFRELCIMYFRWQILKSTFYLCYG